MIAGNIAVADAYYTRMEDIEKELFFYREYFKNKVVLCNCDDPFESNFFKYFAINFNVLGLKKLITIGLENSPVSASEIALFPPGNKYNCNAYKIEITHVESEENAPADLKNIARMLKSDCHAMWLWGGSGDFRSYDCIKLLPEVDIAVTHPPLSLFSEYIRLLLNYEKKFLVIGNERLAARKDIADWMASGLLRMDMNKLTDGMEFEVPLNVPCRSADCRTDGSGKKYLKIRDARWFTNLESPETWM